MITRTLRLALLAVLSAAAIAYAPFHYSWRWERNHRLFEQERIGKDHWAAEQFFIPVEAWGIVILGTACLLFVGWRLFIRRSHEHIPATA